MKLFTVKKTSSKMIITNHRTARVTSTQLSGVPFQKFVELWRLVYAPDARIDSFNWASRNSQSQSSVLSLEFLLTNLWTNRLLIVSSSESILTMPEMSRGITLRTTFSDTHSIEVSLQLSTHSLCHSSTQPVDVAELEREDPEVRKIIDILEGDRIDQQFKFKSNHYVIRGDILCRIVFRDSRPHFLLVVLARLQQEILRNAHDNHGHMGIRSTYERIHEEYYWYDSLRHITKYVTSCVNCQMKKSSLQRPSGLLQPLCVHDPFHTVLMDYMEPFTTSKRRNQYIIVAIDSLTKWVEAKAVHATSAHHAAKFSVE